MKIQVINFDEKYHKYTTPEGVEIKLSTTKVLSEFWPFMAGDRIMASWLKKLGRKGNKKAADLGEKVESEIIPLLAIERDTEARNGTLAHEMIEVFLNEGLIVTPKVKDLENKVMETNHYAFEYYKGLKAQLLKLGIKRVIAQEKPLLDVELQVAGKFDALVELNSGETAILDFKTGSRVEYDKLHKVVLQLGHYAKMGNELIKKNNELEDGVMHFSEVRPVIQSITKAFCIFSGEVEKEHTTKDRYEKMTDTEKMYYVPVDVKFMKDLPKEKTGQFFLENTTLDLSHTLKDSIKLFELIFELNAKRKMVENELKQLSIKKEAKNGL